MGLGKTRSGSLLVAVAAATLLSAAPADAAGPPRLSRDTTPAYVASDHGGGIFGGWRVDRFGLPFYRYTMDPDGDLRAPQPELNGNPDAWHQIGNDRIVATAHNRGHIQLWSQDRLFQWTNRTDPANGHHTGGYGYLRVGDRTISTLYADRPAGATTERDFGAGYFRRRTASAPVDIEEHAYAPYGDDPVLLHDVTIRNTSSAPLSASWFEYWDVNPYAPFTKAQRGLGLPDYDEPGRTLSVAQLPQGGDTRPLSIFAAALNAPVADYETDATRFFGSGGRGNPTAVASGTLLNGTALPVGPGTNGRTLFALRTPITLAPGESTTLRYAYGTAHPDEISGLVSRWRDAPDPLERSQAEWKRWLPRAKFEGERKWLARELQWSAYTLRSGVSYEEECGKHILSQGGYYQYDNGAQIAYRDPLQHVLPLIHAEPWIAREVIEYSAQEQPRGGGQIPYGMAELCKRFDLGSSNDLDLWLLLAAAEYGLATRDFGFFDRPVRWADLGEASLWEHLKAAHAHQESQRGPHGGYVVGATGDWSDFSPQFTEMTESILVSAQLTYIYPRLAELADARGDRDFAAALRADAAELLEVTRREWTGRGWFSRGYSGDRQLGRGVIFGEPQPWGLLGGAADRERAATLVGNIRRFLTGVGAPPEVKGPARIGSSQSPARVDPDVTERTTVGTGVGSNNAVYVGGVWYAINGWLTWALGELDGVVPNAREYALDELERNTLAAHAHAFPHRWQGTISVDDACHAHYEPDPSQCGIYISSGTWAGQIMHQPAWSLWDAIKLAGIDPTARGYRIDPHLPLQRFSLRLPAVGIEAKPGSLRGYIRAERAGGLAMEVERPRGVPARRLRAFVDGRRVKHRLARGIVRFTLPARAGKPVDWAVTRG